MKEGTNSQMLKVSISIMKNIFLGYQGEVEEARHAASEIGVN